VPCGTDSVDLALGTTTLRQRGMPRILTKGAPSTFVQLHRAGHADDLCLSLTPILIGPGPGRIVAGEGAPAPTTGLSLPGLLEEDGALFVRYLIHPA
jgi:riboflavin biosynthesis pyrimidine reductase